MRTANPKCHGSFLLGRISLLVACTEPLRGALGTQEARRSTDLMRFVLIHVIVYKKYAALSLLSHSGWAGLSQLWVLHPPKAQLCSEQLGTHFTTENTEKSLPFLLNRALRALSEKKILLCIDEDALPAQLQVHVLHQSELCKCSQDSKTGAAQGFFPILQLPIHHLWASHRVLYQEFPVPSSC